MNLTLDRGDRVCVCLGKCLSWNHEECNTQSESPYRYIINNKFEIGRQTRAALARLHTAVEFGDIGALVVM